MCRLFALILSAFAIVGSVDPTVVQGAPGDGGGCGGGPAGGCLIDTSSVRQ